MHYANHFPAKNALDCRILRIQSQKIFRGDTPDRAAGGGDPDTNFRLARQCSHCSCVTKRPLVRIVNDRRLQFRGTGMVYESYN